MRIPQGLRSALASQTGGGGGSSPPTTDEYFGDVGVLLYGDGTNGSAAIVDSSSNGHTVNVNGTAQISTTESKFGGSSMYFSGSGNYLTIPSDSSFDFGTGDFTIEFWMNPTYPNSSWQAIISRNYSSTYGWRLYKIMNSNNFAFYQSGGSHINTSGVTMTAGTWYHIAVVRSGTTITIYVDGVAKGSGASTTNLSPTTALEIGQGVVTSAYPYYGYLDDLRITKGVARYTSNFTPPTASFSTVTPGEKYFYQNSLLLSADGSNGSTAIVDSSANAHTITANGNAQISTTQSKFGGSSLYFDGTGDYLASPVSDTLSLGTSDFTIECWAWRLANAPANSVLLQMSNSADIYSALFGFAASGNFLVYLSSAGASWDIASGQVLGSIDNETWVHYALTRQGSTFRTFKNGVQQSTWTSSASIYQAGNQVRIGAGQSYAACNYGGYIDDLRITKGVARYTSDFTIPTSEASSSDPYFSNTTLLLNGNGTNGSTDFVDSTGNFVNYANSDASATNGEGPNGGTPYWVDILPASANFHYSNNSRGLNVIHNGLLNTNNMLYWTGSQYNTGSVTQARFDLRDFSTVTSVRIYAEQPYIGSSYHPYEARLLDSNKNVISNTTLVINNSTPQWLTVPVAGSPAFLELYAPTNPGARLYLFGIEVNGQELISKPITANGNAQISTAQNKFGGASLYFDGTGDYLTLPSDSSLDISTGAYTVELWIYFESAPSTNVILGFAGTSTVGNAQLVYSGSNLYWQTRGTGTHQTAYSWTPSTSTWYHLAVSWDGTNNLRMFIDGQVVATNTVSPAINQNGLNVGGASDGYGIHGYIDDLRITKGVARYGNFTPPTAGFSTLTPVEPYFHNNSLLLHGDGTNGSTTFKDDSINNHTITVNGNAQISTAQSKFGGSSMYFDGNGDYLSVADSDAFHIGAGDFTIEAWLYKELKGTYHTLLGQRVNSTNEWRIILDLNTAGNGYSEGRLRFDWGSGSYNWDAGIPVDTWTHIAIVRSGTTGTLYVNGTAVTGTTTLSNIGNYAAPLLIGSNTGSGEYYKGYIDDLRITKGVARYTSNFTPPTSALPSL